MKIEGRNGVREALVSGQKIEKIMLSSGSNDKVLNEIVALAKEKRVKLLFLPNEALNKESVTKKHQGVIAFCDDFKYAELEGILNVAKDFIKNYTGYDNLDKFSSFVIVVYVLCQDMYDNRSYYVDNTNVNKVVQTILDMHSVDLL